MNLKIVEKILQISINVEALIYKGIFLEYNRIIELKNEFEDHLRLWLMKEDAFRGGSVWTNALQFI